MEVVVVVHVAWTTTSKPKRHLGIMTCSKRKLITPERKPPSNIQEVMVADLPEATTTPKQPLPLSATTNRLHLPVQEQLLKLTAMPDNNVIRFQLTMTPCKYAICLFLSVQ
jgi:hypothetical protein